MGISISAPGEIPTPKDGSGPAATHMWWPPSLVRIKTSLNKHQISKGGRVSQQLIMTLPSWPQFYVSDQPHFSVGSKAKAAPLLCPYFSFKGNERIQDDHLLT